MLQAQGIACKKAQGRRAWRTLWRTVWRTQSLVGLEVRVGEGWDGLALWGWRGRQVPGGEEPCEINYKCRPYPSSKGRLLRNVISRGVTGSDAPHDGSERPLWWQTEPVTSTTAALTSSLLMEPELSSIISCLMLQGRAGSSPSGWTLV